MTNEEFQEWEEETKEAEQDIKRMSKILFGVIIIGGILYIISNIMI